MWNGIPANWFPRVGFIVTNLSRSAERVVAFYNHRGTAEQHIKEATNALRWTRGLSTPEVPQQRGPVAASCPGLQSGQNHADACVAEGGRALVIDHATGEVRPDHHQIEPTAPDPVPLAITISCAVGYMFNLAQTGTTTPHKLNRDWVFSVSPPTRIFRTARSMAPTEKHGRGQSSF